MESLVANYASSDEEEEQQQKQRTSSTKAASSLFSSLPRPKSSPLFSSIPQLKHHQQQPPHKIPISKTPIDTYFEDEEQEKADAKKTTSNSDKSSSSSIFSIPQAKSQTPQQPLSAGKPIKKVVQFRPPPIQSNDFSDEDEDDEDEEEKERKNRNQSQFLNQNSSVKSFLSNIPAPKSSATLGVFPSSTGSGRRSIIDTEAPAPTSDSDDYRAKNKAGQNEENYKSNEVGSDQNYVNYGSYQSGIDQNLHSGDASGYVNYSSYQSGIEQNLHSGDASIYVNNGSHNSSEDYNNGYGDYGQYGMVTTAQATAGMVESGIRMKGKRGRNEIPAEIVEVKQDELIKDRPREDQVKLTGIAFGPSYQPASTKGKPNKIHKRKHQIGSLYFDMKQKEMELAERRSRGLLTKAQTQGKYGW